MSGTVTELRESRLIITADTKPPLRHSPYVMISVKMELLERVTAFFTIHWRVFISNDQNKFI